jgi:hypothetical protein
MIYVNFQEQSNAADWIESIQLLAEDNSQPVWATPPIDLVVTMNVIPEGVCTSQDYSNSPSVANAAVITASATPALSDGKLTIFDDGFIEISIDDSLMLALGPDQYGIAKRYLVFLKIQTEGFTIQFVVGVLPVIKGA